MDIRDEISANGYIRLKSKAELLVEKACADASAGKGKVYGMMPVGHVYLNTRLELRQRTETGDKPFVHERSTPVKANTVSDRQWAEYEERRRQVIGSDKVESQVVEEVDTGIDEHGFVKGVDYGDVGGWSVDEFVSMAMEGAR